MHLTLWGDTTSNWSQSMPATISRPLCQAHDQSTPIRVAKFIILGLQIGLSEHLRGFPASSEQKQHLCRHVEKFKGVQLVKSMQIKRKPVGEDTTSLQAPL